MSLLLLLLIYYRQIWYRSMQETEAAPHAEPFRQGDIIRLVDRDEKEIDPPIGIIINADCDLANCKIEGVVAYISVLPFEQHFRRYWIPNFIDDRFRTLAKSIEDACGLDCQAFGELEDWVREEPHELVAKRLAETYSAKEKKLLPLLQELSEISRSPSRDSTLLLKMLGIQGRNKHDTLTKYAKDALRSLGDGYFFLNEIAGLPAIGFVARLRRIHSIGDHLLFPSLSDLRIADVVADVRAVRIARLTDLYRFRLAQLFAYQFSRIGLPDEVIALNDVAVQAAVSNLGGLDA